MRILMFGWEFPPHLSGGLGTACFGITRGLADLGHEITFVLPKTAGGESSHVEILSAPEILNDAESSPEDQTHISTDAEDDLLEKISMQPVGALLSPYLTEARYRLDSLLRSPDHYGPDLISEVTRYGKAASAVAAQHAFDVIHAHDWMSIFAGIHARRISGKPFILHIHSLEFDRSGENINRKIYDIERYGMQAADHIIAVSQQTKKMMTDLYEIDPEKITVVHNAVFHEPESTAGDEQWKADSKTVLFLGRITFQKGPDYFIEAAAEVLKTLPDVTFLMAGAGDMMPGMIERVAELGIGQHFHFTGFLQGEDIEKIFSMADLYVMPSVSEPFGISPLEAIAHGVPVIISKQSGVAEILYHAPKVDFWNVGEIADQIALILTHPELAKDIVRRCREDIRDITWKSAADKIAVIYREAGTAPVY